MKESSSDVSRAAASANLLFLLKGWLVLVFLMVMVNPVSLSLVLSMTSESGLLVDSKLKELAESWLLSPSVRSIEETETFSPKKTGISSSESGGGGVMKTESPVP